MTAYLVNRQFYYNNLELAINKAKEIIRQRIKKEYTCNEQWKVTQGKNKGYCVKLNDNWYIIGNDNLLRVTIQTIKIEGE